MAPKLHRGMYSFNTICQQSEYALSFKLMADRWGLPDDTPSGFGGND